MSPHEYDPLAGALGQADVEVAITPGQALGYALELKRRRVAGDEKEVQRAVTTLAKFLTDPDELRRRAAVEYVVRACLPEVVARLVDRLVRRLGAGDGTARRQVAASLVQFGPRSLPTLVVKFRKARGAGKQLAITEVLYQIAPGLGPDERLKLMAELMILARFARDASVAAGLGRVAAVLRRVGEVEANQAGRHDAHPRPPEVLPAAPDGADSSSSSASKDSNTGRNSASLRTATAPDLPAPTENCGEADGLAAGRG
jgi:hypothetical protein